MNDLISKTQSATFHLLLLIAGLMIAGLPFKATAQQSSISEQQHFTTIKKNMQAAVDSMNKKKMIQSKYAMEDFTGIDNELIQKLAHYYMGYAAYRLSTQFSDVNEDHKEQYLNEAQKQFEKTVKMDPSFAEGHTMLASVYGMKAAGFFSGMKYGPKSNSANEKALETGPRNPRVHMGSAIGLLKKPSMFGGSTEDAIKEFKKAADLFESFEPANELMPDWGQAENYAWLGQAYEESEQYNKAKKAYEQALDIDSNYQWVKHVLMPQLVERME